MKNPKTYTVQFRRKRQGKTNYKKRLKLLKSSLPRLVIRPSSKNIQAQIIKFDPKGDIIIASSHSREIEKLGWTFHKGNAAIAYLVGLSLGKKAKQNEVKKAILDIGLKQPIKGSNIFACLKGALDAGLEIAHSPKILPKEDRINGKSLTANNKDERYAHIQEKFQEIKNKITQGDVEGQKPSSIEGK